MHKKKLHELPDTSKGYDLTDLEVSTVAKGVLGFFVFAAIAGALGMGFLQLYGRVGVHEESYESRRIPAPPNPLLQNNITKETDIYNLRAREDEMLNKPGWNFRDKGIARIPIKQAMAAEAAEHANVQPDPNVIPEGVANFPASPRVTNGGSDPVPESLTQSPAGTPAVPDTSSPTNSTPPPNSTGGATSKAGSSVSANTPNAPTAGRPVGSVTDNPPTGSTPKKPKPGDKKQ